jgi:four helix bundle protein
MSYENLNVWRKAIDLAKSVYLCTQNFPKEEKFTLVSQMRRAAVSIPSNIAEGSSRHTDKDFANFLVIARGSLAELHTQIIISHEMRLIDDITNKKLTERIADIGKMLNGLRNNLTSDKRQGAND